MGLEKICEHAVSIVQSLALGRPHGTHGFWQMCVIHIRDSGWRVQCVFLFVCNYFIKYLVGNFTLALTDLTAAAQAAVPGSQIKLQKRDAAECAPTRCHVCRHRGMMALGFCF